MDFFGCISSFQMPTVVQQQRMEVEQLRREAAMKRIQVSQAVEDIKVRNNNNNAFNVVIVREKNEYVYVGVFLWSRPVSLHILKLMLL